MDLAVGTLYTAVYYPRRGAVEVRWPGHTVRQTLATFETVEMYLSLPKESGNDQ